MQQQRLAQLTNAQREALRLFHVRKSAKEIGRLLNITHWAVNERLRAARRVLGVATSAEAADLLARDETTSAYKRVVCDADRIAATPDRMDVSPPDDGQPRPRPEGGGKLREDRANYMHEPFSGLRLPLPRHWGERNDLTSITRLKWISAIAFGIIFAVGALVSVAWGVVRIVSQLIRAF